MSNEDKTDYKPGDPPVPTGSVVEYRGRDYEIVEHQELRRGVPEPEVNYPDGVAYLVHPTDLPKGFGSTGWVAQVRRRSFRVKVHPEAVGEEKRDD